MNNRIDLKRLQAPFAPEDIEWKPIAISKQAGKALVAPYVTNRAIMDRLDEVCVRRTGATNSGPDRAAACSVAFRSG
ncbi:hypothetical protein [Rhodothermus marinus]|uniref:hypothetical protein n=1 Tax=Rhodothermus marinus TaxID=29549 RepID=UPI000A543DE2|nr:hypothetical protein [Rhodothermus marinus]